MNTLSFTLPLVERLLRGDYRVLITGASGWLGRASLEMLSGAYGEVFSERVNCFGSSAQMLHIRGGPPIEQRPLSSMQALDRRRYILLHFACLTKDKVARLSLDEYRATNRLIARSTKEAAERIGVERVFLVSSGAVYQALAAPLLAESMYPYGALKLEDEALFSRFAHEQAGRRVVTARLFNLSGPYINKLSSYALSSFIEQAREPLAHASIRINSDHPVIRSYVSVGNLLNVAIAHLLDDATGPFDCFDTAGDRDVEVLELAETVKAIVNPNVPIMRPVLSSGGAERYVGDGTKFRSLASRYDVSLHDLTQQVRDTAEYLGALPRSTQESER